MIKLAILDDYQNITKNFKGFEELKNECQFVTFTKPFADEIDTISQLKDFDALMLMRERTSITKKVINELKNLKYIFTSGMRNKAIDLNAAQKKNIIVCGTDINSNPTAEITWALILGLARNMKTEIDNMYQGYWQTTIGVELKNKVLGIIGLGKVGSQVAKIGNAFGMQVVAWSENLNLSTAKELNVLPMTKDELIKSSDFISLHVVLGERYKNLITNKELELMKKTAYLINTSRGPIIKEEDLIDALKTNKIAGAGLDVYNIEPLPLNHKLRFLPNVLLMPHLGYVTEENYSIFYSQMIENLKACLSGNPIKVIK